MFSLLLLKIMRVKYSQINSYKSAKASNASVATSFGYLRIRYNNTLLFFLKIPETLHKYLFFLLVTVGETPQKFKKVNTFI